MHDSIVCNYSSCFNSAAAKELTCQWNTLHPDSDGSCSFAVFIPLHRATTNIERADCVKSAPSQKYFGIC